MVVVALTSQRPFFCPAIVDWRCYFLRAAEMRRNSSLIIIIATNACARVLFLLFKINVSLYMIWYSIH